jgi:hypothetical protein
VGNEKRKDTRKPISPFFQIVDTRTGRVMGELENLSEFGFMMISTKDLPAQKTYRVYLTMPEDFYPSNKERIEFEIATRWAVPDQDVFRVGCELVRPRGNAKELFEVVFNSM